MPLPRFLRFVPVLCAFGVYLWTDIHAAPPASPTSADVTSLTTADLEVRAAAAEIGSEAQRLALLELSSRMLGEDERDRLLVLTDQLYATFPDDDEVCRKCGFYWIQAAEWERLAPLLSAREMQTDAPIETLRAGVKAAREHRLLDSLVCLEAAHRASPEEPKILLNLGSFYCRFGRGEEGLQLLQEITELVPDDPYGYLAVAKAAKSLRKVDTGLAAINAAQAIIRENPVYQQRLARELESLIEYFVENDAGTVAPASEEVP